MAVNRWTRDELLLALNLYFQILFSKITSKNPKIILMAEQIGRTPSAVAMKLLNLSSFDPIQKARGVVGLSQASNADKAIWDEFNANSEAIAFEIQQRISEFTPRDSVESEKNFKIEYMDRPTEATYVTRIRLVQKFFRDAVLLNYNFRCAICQLNIPELLNASHIIPWSQNVKRRADPSNGLSLCVLHDRAFDRGLLTLDASFRVVISSRLKKSDFHGKMLSLAFLKIEGQVIHLPTRFIPDSESVAYHRENIFKQ